MHIEASRQINAAELGYTHFACVPLNCHRTLWKLLSHRHTHATLTSISCKARPKRSSYRNFSPFSALVDPLRFPEAPCNKTRREPKIRVKWAAVRARGSFAFVTSNNPPRFRENSENNDWQHGRRERERAAARATRYCETPFATTVLDYEIASTSSRREASGGEQMTADDKGICFTPPCAL